MTPEEYKRERKKRGTQQEVARKLGIRTATLSDRENGKVERITKEMELSLLALPLKDGS